MDKLATLRALMNKSGIDLFIVPSTDEYQNEYVPPAGRRLAWLTNFTGSMGIAAVLADEAFIFTDGRYTLQVLQQVDAEQYTPVQLANTSFSQWLKGHARQGQRIAIDPWLHTISEVNRFQKIAENAGAELMFLSGNLIDQLWQDRPDLPKSEAFALADDYTGQSVSQKIDRLSVQLQKDGLDAALIPQSDSVCWLLNVRGGDVENTPLVLSYAILYADGKVDWFVNPDKVPSRLGKIMPDNVTIHLDTDLEAGIQSLSGLNVGLDDRETPYWFYHALDQRGAQLVTYKNPCSLPKACKNPVEIQGAKNAHIRDGVAMVRFLDWFYQEAPTEKLTELSVADHLATLRAEGENFKGLSFDTIAGVGPNGAIVHYQPNESSNRPIKVGDILLLDSGAQYLDGTTDITRTLWVGDNEPEAPYKEAYTRVLKGHIALAVARFPDGTSGSQLDVLARQFLWQAGMDYEHGTGHGVGSFLSVHEGPARISKKMGDAPLKPGMILSNEPGYYVSGEFGIRLENLVLVKEAEQSGWLEFETLTLAPFDLKLVDKSLLTEAEIQWLNDYHRHIREELSSSIDTKVLTALIPEI